MKFGVATFITDEGVGPRRLGAAVEERGFHCLNSSFVVYPRVRQFTDEGIADEAGRAGNEHTMEVHSFRQPRETARCGAANQRTTA
jgi:hypothetical protein